MARAADTRLLGLALAELRDALAHHGERDELPDVVEEGGDDGCRWTV